MTSNKATLLNLVLRALGLTGEAGSLENVSKQTLTVILAALRRLREKEGADLEADVSKHLNKHPNPPDEKFHAWAEGKGVEVDKAEATAYRLASTHAKFREDGKANEQGVTPAAVDPEELRMGIEVEHEHTPDAETAKRIATDHLAEIPDYYTRLKRMEDEAKADKTAAEYGFIDGYLRKRAEVEADYSSTAKPDRERLRRQHGNDSDTGAAEAIEPGQQEPRPDSVSSNTESTRMRDLPWIKTRAQELDATLENMPMALKNMLKTPEEEKEPLPYQANQQPGAGISRRVVGSGVTA